MINNLIINRDIPFAAEVLFFLAIMSLTFVLKLKSVMLKDDNDNKKHAKKDTHAIAKKIMKSAKFAKK